MPLQWEDVIAPWPHVERHPEESYYAFKLREVEHSNRLRRQLGLQYWRENPTDERRYTWLMVATMLEPAYPIDIRVWTNRREQLTEPTFLVDNELVREWDDVFTAMRQEFWEAESVTDTMRRYLSFAEIVTEGNALTWILNNAPDLQQRRKLLITSIVDFFADFPRSTSVSDSAAYEWQTSTLMDLGLSVLVDSAQQPKQSAPFCEATRTAVQSLERWAIDEVKFAQVCARWSESTDAAPDEPQDLAASMVSLIPSPIVRDQPDSWAARYVMWHKREIYALQARYLGLHHVAPTGSTSDVRTWLKLTIQSFPAYSTNVAKYAYDKATDAYAAFESDSMERNRWGDEYDRLRLLVAENAGLPSDEDALFLAFETMSDIRRALLNPDETLTTKDVDQIGTNIAVLFEAYQREGLESAQRDAYAIVRLLLNQQTRLGIENEKILRLLSEIPGSQDSSFDAVVAGWIQRLDASLLDLMNLDLRTLEGIVLKPSNFEGKIVLLDFWATTCTACISAFPRLHETHLRYRDRGFEVLSVGFDAQRRKSRVHRIKTELGLSWTTLVADHAEAEIRQTFGLFGIPEYRLIARDGRIVAGTAEVDMGRNLEALLDEMLAAEAVEKDAATVH